MPTETSTPPQRETILGGDPFEVFIVPEDTRFASEGGEQITYLEADELRTIGHALISKMPEFSPLIGLAIDYYWKRKGGSSGVKRRFGECVKASDLVRVYGKIRFIIWLAADHSRDVQLVASQVEALLYHQLSHIEEHERGYWRKRDHDFSGFDGEIDRYGAWQSDLHAMAEKVMHAQGGPTSPLMQMDKLPGMEQESFDVGELPEEADAIHRLRTNPARPKVDLGGDDDDEMEDDTDDASAEEDDEEEGGDAPD